MSRLRRRLVFRYFSARIFWLMGLLSVIVCTIILGGLILSIGYKGYCALYRTEIKLVIDRQIFADNAPLTERQCKKLITTSLANSIESNLSSVEQEKMFKLISPSSPRILCKSLEENSARVGKKFDFWLPVSGNVDYYYKHQNQVNLSEQELIWIQFLADNNYLHKRFNKDFFLGNESREPELAGILSSVVGSIFTVLVSIIFALPVSILAAIFLEEYAPRNKFITFVELNINNLAAVPSVVFGLLGLFLYISLAEFPRSSSLVAGLTLGLMIIPTLVIATRVSLRSVPNSLRHAALALGASPLQTTFHFTVPAALPGIMTGCILAISRIMGETAPLIMIGMVAFIVDIPTDVLAPATVMPVQVFLWSDNPEYGFIEKTAAAIMILLLVLIAINSLAVYIRRKYDIRW